MGTQQRSVSDSSSAKAPSVAPFLKWAGGKRWFVTNHCQLLPETFKKYYEPFLGSAAVYFHLAPKSAVLSDANEELIGTYLAIQSDWEAVCQVLEKHEEAHSDEYYYTVRASKPRSPHGRAARFLYLNRTCWNGLYRVNKHGEFNVPRGTKDSVTLANDDFPAVAERLQTAEVLKADFEETIDRASSGDFIFVDPPYTVKHNTNGFLKYNQKIFSWEDQIRLRDALARAHSRGVMFAMTNAMHESVITLYSQFAQLALGRHSVLSGLATARGKTEELFVSNYL